jgi:hypothetical protein
MNDQLAFERRIVLLGYYRILERAPGNGATIHRTKQYMTVLKMRLGMGADITPQYENEIKNTIRRLYLVDNSKNHNNLLE